MTITAMANMGTVVTMGTSTKDNGNSFKSVWNWLVFGLGIWVVTGVDNTFPAMAQTNSAMSSPSNSVNPPSPALPINASVNSSVPPKASCGTSLAAQSQKAQLRTSSQASDQTLYAALISQHGLDLAACRSRSGMKSYGLRLQLPPQANGDTVAALVDQAVDQGYNQLFVEVVNGEGLVLLPSQELPRPWLPQQTIPQPQPTTPEAGNPPAPVAEIDLWQAIITAGQKRGVKVHGVITWTIDPYDPFAPSLQDLLPLLRQRQPESLIFDFQGQGAKPLNQMGNGSRLQLLHKLSDPNLQSLLQKFLTQGNLTAADITAIENQAPARPLRRRSQNPALTAQLTQTAFTDLAKTHQVIGQVNLLQKLLYDKKAGDRPKPKANDLPQGWGLWHTVSGLGSMVSRLPNENLTAPLAIYPTVNFAEGLTCRPTPLTNPSLSNPPLSTPTSPASAKCSPERRDELRQMLSTIIKDNHWSPNAGAGIHLAKSTLRPAAVCPVVRVSDTTSLDLEQLLATMSASPAKTMLPSCLVVHLVPEPQINSSVNPSANPPSGGSQSKTSMKTSI